MNKNTLIVLGVIFLFALILRFLYFPGNVYFGFDQARDAFAALEILKGNLRLIGPPTGVEGWYHGPLYYYIYAPVYFFFDGNPEGVAGLLRIINAGGIFLIFLIASVLFNKTVGLFSSLLFAISFEQTQYALYFNHPSLAVVSVLIFYLGLALFFFRKENKGLILASLGLGLSIQFEFVLLYLIFILVTLIIFLKHYIPKPKTGLYLFSFFGLLLTVSTFIISELKFNMRSATILLSIISNLNSNGLTFGNIVGNVFLISNRLIYDNFISFGSFPTFLLIVLLAFFLMYLRNNDIRPKLVFLFVWFLGGWIPYLGNKSLTPLYYYNVGASASFLIFSSFLIQKIWAKTKLTGLGFLIIIFISNIMLITKFNPGGPINTINVQSGMLLSDEKKAIDYIYREAKGVPFAINSLSMPLNVNTTWSYLFEWYGGKKYRYLPVWGGDAAMGYPGNLQIQVSRSNLPKMQFLIIEPSRGIRAPLIDKFMDNEAYFSDVVSEEQFGQLVVQSRRGRDT